MTDIETCLRALKDMADRGVTSDEAIDAALSDHLSACKSASRRLDAIEALIACLKRGGEDVQEPRAFWQSVTRHSEEWARVVRADKR